MIAEPLFYKLLLVSLVWLCLVLHLVWSDDRARAGHSTPLPAKPPRKRSQEPKPFAGLTQQPLCTLCEQEIAHPTAPPPLRPDPMPPTHRRPREVDTSMHFCPSVGCAYQGWLGLGKPPCQRSSQWGPLASVPLYLLPRLLFGDAWHALAWQAGCGRVDCTGAGVLG